MSADPDEEEVGEPEGEDDGAGSSSLSSFLREPAFAIAAVDSELGAWGVTDVQ